MFSGIRKRVKKAGQPPGTPIYTGSKKDTPPSIRVIVYSPSGYEEVEANRYCECEHLMNAQGTIWVNVEGLYDIDLIKQLATRFNLHPLTVEDILNTDQRPKVEEFEDYLFVTLKALDWKADTKTFHVRQLSLILAKNFILSFQEFDTTRFDQIRQKLHGTSQRLRDQGSDYLAYRLIDAVVDEYFFVLESMGDRIETVEDKIIRYPTPQNSRTIYRLKRQMLLLRKAIWPMREALSHLLHMEDDFITKFTRVYLRDVYDHTMQAIDTLETFRDMLSSLLDMYLSTITNRMNEIMKTLTVITTIFIPITAIASFYGMNFADIPGLHWAQGYLAVLMVMIALACVMLIYFRHKRWL